MHTTNHSLTSPYLFSPPLLNAWHVLFIQGQTHCVDTTITNILEGRVSYTPEKEDREAKSDSDGKTASSGNANEVSVFLMTVSQGNPVCLFVLF